MANVDGQTLLMAVQAVQAQIQSLEAQIAPATENQDISELGDLLLAYTQAADTLHRAYEAEELLSSNLPPHDMLLPSR